MSPIRGVVERRGAVNITPTIHAAVILVLPTVAMVLALIMAARQGVSRWEIVLLVLMYFATMTGISLGMHRLLAHRAFEPNRPLRIALVILGSMAAQGPPIYWATNHRRHHAHSDGPGDLHSPHIKGDRRLNGLHGLWHAHVAWTFDHALTSTPIFSKDLLQDADLAIVNRQYYLWVLIGLVLPAAAGFVLEGTINGLISGVLWGGGVRLFLSYHFISTINSVLHLSGYRRFDTNENSRNNPWLAIPTLGEAWHNNHHANTNAANFSAVWWEFDCGWQLIRVFRWFGWIHSVKQERIVDQRCHNGKSLETRDT